MSIKNKLILIAASIIVALGSLTAMMKYSLDQIDYLRETDGLVSGIEVNMLTLRRNEKDFLARGWLKYRDAFGEHVAIMEQNLTELGSRVKTLGIDTKGVAALNESLKRYIEGFKSIAAIEESIGLDEKSGWKGSLREAVHQAEQHIKEADDYHLLADMLMLRRNEKDFLLRQDIKYRSQFDENFKTLLSTLSAVPIAETKRQTILESMQQYKSDFHSLIAAAVDKGLTPKRWQTWIHAQHGA